MASIQERPGASGNTSYRVMFRIDGKQTSETFEDQATALEFAALVDQAGGASARRIRDARSGEGVAAGNIPTLREFFDRWQKTRTDVTEGTIAEDARMAGRSWMPAFGAWPIDTIQRDDITEWIQKRRYSTTQRGERIRSKTVKNEHGLLSTVLTAAVPKHRPDNPARGITIPDDVQEEMVFLTQAEFYILLSYIPEYWRPLVTVAAATGLRWGELTALRWMDVDLVATPPRLTVVQSWKRGATTRVIGTPKTKRSRRTVSLPPRAVAALQPLQDRPDVLVFRGQKGGRVHHQNFHPRVWHRAVGQANDPRDKNGTELVDAPRITKRPRIHDLRHSHASWLINEGVDLFKISRRLGHESIQTTTDTYGHLLPDHLEVTAAAAEAALTPPLLPSRTALEAADEFVVVEVDE
ncbi:tyrosine-type recombinase/integrase [Haloactinopolyspora alba]|nr:site-specific integrase [Haloactinopolyspora alba]